MTRVPNFVEYAVQECINNNWYTHMLTSHEKSARDEYTQVTVRYAGRKYRLVTRKMPEWEELL